LYPERVSKIFDFIMQDETSVNMSLTLNKTYPRKYIKPEFSPKNKESLQDVYTNLINYPIDTEKGYLEFLEFWSELSCVVDEAGSVAYVNMTCDTKNKEAESEYLHLVQDIFPICHENEDKVKKKFLRSEFLKKIDPAYYGLFIKQTVEDDAIYRQENIELFTKDSILCQNFQKITGSWMVEFDGKRQTAQQIQVYQENPDRSIREAAYRARVAVHLEDVPKLEDLYDEMLVVRKQIATNSGFKNYRDYKFVANARFDYNPEDCLRFHDAIEEELVPLLTEWNKEKCKKLNIPTLRPWDLYVDPDSKGVIKAFETEEEFCDKVQKIFEGVHPKTGEYFKYMRENKLLDLSSREGKAPGGYMTELSEKRVPFIFMNAVGTKRDVDTLLHEGGHSIHAFQARDQILKSYRSSPLEFAEVASMSMELLGRPFFQHVYKHEDIERVKKEQLIKIVEFFPFMSMIDSFQHWVYTTEDNGREARGKKWQELNRRFQPYLDMSGMDEIEKTRWQYSHIYTVPFYYIEYGIAQVGALQVWKNSLKDPIKAVDDYLAGLALGGSKPLPELFKAANISFAMDKTTLKELVSIIKDQVA
jgi:oligoendopeptidase F